MCEWGIRARRRREARRTRLGVAKALEEDGLGKLSSVAHQHRFAPRTHGYHHRVRGNNLFSDPHAQHSRAAAVRRNLGDHLLHSADLP
jgi:hypothetical protein